MVDLLARHPCCSHFVGSPPANRGPVIGDCLQVLERRCAVGEISTQEFDELLGMTRLVVR